LFVHAAFGRQLDGFVSAASRPERSAQAATVRIDSGGLGDGKPLQLIADLFRNRVQPTHGSDQRRVSTVLANVRRAFELVHAFAVHTNLSTHRPGRPSPAVVGRETEVAKTSSCVA
jgi:hypothetical protein